MYRPAAVLILLTLSTGCSNEELKLVSSDQIAAFRTGKTSEAEVTAALGQPVETVLEADGTKIAQYPFGGTASGSSSFMPAFLSSRPGAYGMVSFSYGSNGVLKAIDGAGGK